MKLFKLIIFLFFVSVFSSLSRSSVFAYSISYIDVIDSCPQEGLCSKGGTDCPHCETTVDTCCAGGTNWTLYNVTCTATQDTVTDPGDPWNPYVIYYITVYIESLSTPVYSTGDKCLTGETGLHAGYCDGSYQTSGFYKYCCTSAGLPEPCVQYSAGQADNDGQPPPEGECPGGWLINGTTVRSSPCTPISTCTGTCYSTPVNGNPPTNCNQYDDPTYVGWDYTTASGTCPSGQVCCTRAACPAEVTCTSSNAGQTVADGHCKTKVCPVVNVSCNRCSDSYNCKRASWTNSGDCSVYNPVGSVIYTDDCSCNYNASSSDCISACPSCVRCSDTFNCKRASWINNGSCSVYNPVGSVTYTPDCSCNYSASSSDCLPPTCPAGICPCLNTASKCGTWTATSINTGVAGCTSTTCTGMLTCNDSNTCTTDSCNASNTCVNTSVTPTVATCGASSGSCNTGSFLRWVDQVGSDGFFDWECVGSCPSTAISCSAPFDECNTDSDCNDSNVCTTDTCNNPTLNSSTCSNTSVTPTVATCGASSGSCTTGTFLNWVDQIGSDGDYNWNCVGSCPSASIPCSIPSNQPPVFNGLVIKNNLGGVVSPEASNRNQICQTDFNGSRSVTFEVSASDPNGISDITNITLSWNGHTIPRISAIGAVTIFGETFPDSVNNGSVYPLIVTVTDNQGVTDTDNSRNFKFWDCLVSVTGAGYDGSLTGGICSDSNSFTTPIPSAITYSLLMNDVGPGIGTDKSMTVTSPTYSSGSNSLVWGRDYLFQISNFAGSNPSQIKINSTCSNIQFTISKTIVDPYTSSSFVADFSSVLNQDPWWQASGGGVISNNTINDRIPVTCTTETCKISRNGLASSININNTGRSLEDSQSWYYSGSSAKLTNVNTNYSYFYKQYFVKNGVGTTFTSGDKTIADIGSTGIYFVDGNLTIGANKTLVAGNFLMIIVKGDINVSSTVNRVDGILVANNINATGIGSSLVFNGSLFAFNNVDFSRSFTNKASNNLSPAIVVVHNPQLLFTLPNSLTKVLTNWQWGN